ncbi:MAG: type II toxin-antitoxin system RelE/ParE family toxin [Bacteroidales bacterium]|nr:type II toxin-antitoxin system RelE/ParE family toxin [Bacteroidales bacterium]
MSKYHISRKAIEDLEGIWKYTASEWSEEQASDYYRQLYISIRNLATIQPYLRRDFSVISPELLGFMKGHHIIFFEKHSDGSVWVDRILHEKMDFHRYL